MSKNDPQEEQPQREVRRHISSPSRFNRNPRPGFQKLEQPNETSEDFEQKLKKDKKKKINERTPNILGGGLAIVSIILVFLLIRAYPQNDAKVAGATNAQKSDRETIKAMQKIQSDVQNQIDTAKEQAENFNVKDATSPQVNKVLDDVESIQNVPQKIAKDLTAQGSKVVGDALKPFVRLQKIVQDAISVKDMVMEKIGDL
ncbi:MAG: hypothetical protein HY428_01615 [Candidatus Levybacteria bacterium]|nr:hypothetical protein [Candidatus Levybacteria bacterium]